MGIKLKSPNTFLIIFSFVIIMAALTWIVPSGEYQRTLLNGRELVVNDSYHSVESNPQGIDDILVSPIKGFVDAALIIGLVLIVGGAFGVFQRTGAVESGIKSIASAYSRSAIVRKLMIPIFMFIFSLAGAVFGMGEELIPMVLFFVPLALYLGYDSIVGVAIPFVGAGAGFAGAFLNPFTIGIAQGIADLPLFSGMEYRLAVWLVITSAAAFFVTRYANKIKSDPGKSLTFELDEKKRLKLNHDDLSADEGILGNHKLVLITFLLGLIILTYGVLWHQWFIEEICGVFFITGIAVGIIGKLSTKEITDSFIDGAKDMISTALIIALARGIVIVATDGRIIDTMLFHLSGIISQLHPVVSSQAMFLVQSFINFFVPSGSGQAALTMPIMAPLSDLVGVSRQTAVLAFQFGDGFSNMIIPTSAITMGVLTLADIPWEKWARWILPLQIIFIVLGLLLLVPPYFMNWQ